MASPDPDIAAAESPSVLESPIARALSFLVSMTPAGGRAVGVANAWQRLLDDMKKNRREDALRKWYTSKYGMTPEQSETEEVMGTRTRADAARAAEAEARTSPIRGTETQTSAGITRRPIPIGRGAPSAPPIKPSAPPAALPPRDAEAEFSPTETPASHVFMPGKPGRRIELPGPKEFDAPFGAPGREAGWGITTPGEPGKWKTTAEASGEFPRRSPILRGAATALASGSPPPDRVAGPSEPPGLPEPGDFDKPPAYETAQLPGTTTTRSTKRNPDAIEIYNRLLNDPRAGFDTGTFKGAEGIMKEQRAQVKSADEERKTKTFDDAKARALETARTAGVDEYYLGPIESSTTPATLAAAHRRAMQSAEATKIADDLGLTGEARAEIAYSTDPSKALQKARMFKEQLAERQKEFKEKTSQFQQTLALHERQLDEVKRQHGVMAAKARAGQGDDAMKIATLAQRRLAQVRADASMILRQIEGLRNSALQMGKAFTPELQQQLEVLQMEYDRRLQDVDRLEQQFRTTTDAVTAQLMQRQTGAPAAGPTAPPPATMLPQTPQLPKTPQTPQSPGVDTFFNKHLTP